jgi:acetate---CoA ligase (ADP-forming)
LGTIGKIEGGYKMLDALFKPKSVAVIGASAKELNVGNRIVKNLVEFGFKGNIYPINAKVGEIRGLKAYPSILDVPTEVDVVHLPIPAVSVPQALDECGQRGTRVAILNGGGFSEAGPAGAAIEEDCISRARRHGIRIFGPNCQGIINTDPEVKAYCNFTFTKPDPGAISIVALSGGVAELIHQTLFEIGAGTRMYASNGNACDISIPEIIRYYGDDEGTKVIVLYVEGLKDPQKFLEVAKNVARKKPILAMKAGRTADGARAAASHTGGLARKDMTTDLIFEKAGILAFRDEAELCRAAALFARQPVPKGKRVGIITNTGGPSVIATDALVTGGLSVPPLSKGTEATLRTKLLPEATVRNPLDVLATANAGHFRDALDAMCDEGEIDSIYISFVTPFFVDCESIARQIAEVSKAGKKPIVCNLMTDKKGRAETISILKEGDVPCYDFPGSAAAALAAFTRYGMTREREEGKVRSFADIDRAKAKAVVDKALAEGRTMLRSDETYAVLSAYAIPVADWFIAHSPEEAKAQAIRLGFPVVLKADSVQISHKTDAGAVVVDLRDGDSVQSAAEKMKGAISDPGVRFLVQRYLPGGREIIVGAQATGDALGHLVMCGLGGIHTEILRDVTFKLSPVTDVEAAEMLASLKAAPLLKGVRNEPGADTAGIAEIAQRVSRMVADLPVIKEMDINPLLAFEKSVCVVDARIHF